jgi:hypothetical protein
MPRFPISTCDRTFELASEYVTSLQYKGPLALSCDDTKLHPGLRTYWDSTKMCHFLVGTTGKPIAITDEGMIRDLVEKHKKDAATKVSFFCTSCENT